MKKSLFAVLLATSLAGMHVPFASAAATPCETMLKDLRAAEGAAKLNASDKAKVAELETKGIERCNADDDERADDFFAQAMKVLGK